MSLTQLRALMVDAAEVGAKKAITDLGISKPFISKAEACKLFGRATVENWMNKKLIQPQRDQSGKFTYRISRLELDALAVSSNRHSHLMVNE
ncbi:MerR family transcriptional regulator [Arcticibacter eurypsychrophilus]|uniref:hypothetical protein n=1 Tax=Arcticibacter eurypsychrophilus TaxID=1434752 RepID=UPI001112E583|nr:hypothetical protein [Arcticibacter eurypsychrophilus]